MSNYYSLIQGETVSPYLANLIAYYPFNANANDFSGNNHNGTFVNPATFVGGKVANAVNFGITTLSTNVIIPDNNDFSFTNNTVDLPFTISCWVNVTQFSGLINRIIVKRGITTHEYQLYILPNGQVEFVKYNNAGQVISQIIQSAVGAVPLNTWKHICITNLNSGTAGLKMYIDGSQTTAPATNNGAYTRMINTSTNVTISDANRDLKHRGLADEVYIWKNREMTAIEVLDIYNKGNSGIALI
jgi:hypothetical protein